MSNLLIALSQCRHRWVWLRLGLAFLFLCSISGRALAQSSDAFSRKTSFHNYPVDKEVKIPLKGDARFYLLKGTAQVKAPSKGNTQIELSVKNLPAVSVLSGFCTTYLVWAINSEGKPYRLGELKSVAKAENTSDRSLKTNVALKSFALIVTAEPHYLMEKPSPLVILENSTPPPNKESLVVTSEVSYQTNNKDYLRTPPVPSNKEKKDPKAKQLAAIRKKTLLFVLGAEYAVFIARSEGAEDDASEEFNRAAVLLEELQNPVGKASDKELEQLADLTISLAVIAERKAVRIREERASQDKIERLTTEANEAKKDLESVGKDNETLRENLANRNRELESSNTKLILEQAETRRLRDEKAELKGQIATLERNAEKAQETIDKLKAESAGLQRRATFFNEMVGLEGFGKTFGQVQRVVGGLTIITDNDLWESDQSNVIADAGWRKYGPLYERLAGKENYFITLTIYVEGLGEAAQLQSLADERTAALSQRLSNLGLNKNRLAMSGVGRSGNLTLAATATKPRGKINPPTWKGRVEITISGL